MTLVLAALLNRPPNSDEAIFPAYVIGSEGNNFEAAMLTSYAEVATPTGIVGAVTGSYLVALPAGVEVLNAGAFGERFAFDAGTIDDSPMSEQDIENEVQARVDAAKAAAAAEAEESASVMPTEAEVLLPPSADPVGDAESELPDGSAVEAMGPEAHMAVTEDESAPSEA